MDERIERIGRAVADAVQVKQGFGEDLKRRILEAADAIFEAHRKGGGRWPWATAAARRTRNIWRRNSWGAF